MRRRKKVSHSKARAVFRRGARTHRLNVRARPVRGGIRL